MLNRMLRLLKMLKGTGLQTLDAQSKLNQMLKLLKLNWLKLIKILIKLKRCTADRQSAIDNATAKRDAAKTEAEAKDAIRDAAKSVFDQKNSKSSKKLIQRIKLPERCSYKC